MRFVFNERKAAQAAAQLLLLHDEQSIDLYHLIKLLYLADRRSLLDTGYTITGDEMVSMRWGPVLSQIYDAVKQQRIVEESFPRWAQYVGRGKGFRVFLRTQYPETDELSPYEIRLLTDTHLLYGHYRFSDFRELTHGFPEWHDPGPSSAPIDPGDILRDAGLPKEQIDEIEALANERQRMTAILGRAS